MGHHFCNRTIEFTNPTAELVQKLRLFISQFRCVAACGMPGAGKTFFLDTMYCDHDRITRWNRNDLYRSMFGGFIDHSFTPDIERFESLIFDKLLTKHEHPIAFEGWLTSRTAREKLLKKFGAWSSLLVVFVGPLDILIPRVMKSNQTVWTKKEVKVQMRILEQGFQYPTQREGWNYIIYLNTCGEDGSEFLMDLLNI